MPHIYNSSFRFSTQTPMTKQDFRKAKHIISHITENPQSSSFREPVDWQAMNLLDYPSIVPNPMDLGTVMNKLNDQKYEFVEQFLDDTELIWDNCKTYNEKGTWIYSLADKLEKNGKKMLKNYFPTVPIQTVKSLAQLALQSVSSQENPSKSKKPERQKLQKQQSSQNDKIFNEDDEDITMSQKIQMVERFKLFNPRQNNEIVAFIKKSCPTALIESDQTVNIILDNIDSITFKQIVEQMQEIEQKSPYKRVKLIE